MTFDLSRLLLAPWSRAKRADGNAGPDVLETRRSRSLTPSLGSHSLAHSPDICPHRSCISRHHDLRHPLVLPHIGGRDWGRGGRPGGPHTSGCGVLCPLPPQVFLNELSPNQFHVRDLALCCQRVDRVRGWRRLGFLGPLAQDFVHNDLHAAPRYVDSVRTL